LIAFSGGGDSLALLRLVQQQLPDLDCRALVVDHNLRSGSDADARRAAATASALGVPVRVEALVWPATAQPGQGAARAARNRALCEEARRLGARIVLLAHTLDDQAETLLLRASAGSGWRGLAGVAGLAPAPVWPEGRGLAFARPLLGARRSQLRQFLRADGAEWIDDPANENERYARVRARRLLRELEGANFDVARLGRLASALRRKSEAFDREAASLIGRACAFSVDQIALDLARWADESDGPIRARALSALLTAASGAEREPSPDAVERLAGALGSGFRGATLGGARLACLGGAVRIGRDPGALTGRVGGGPGLAPLALTRGKETVWDGRLALVPTEAGWRVCPGRAGPVLERDGAALALADWPGKWTWLLSVRTSRLLGEHAA
jgi:tRNA(Ile)-lysidine synthase